jgi:hypothetical protein
MSFVIRGRSLAQTSTQNQPPTQNPLTITEGLEHATFSGIPEVEFQHPANNTSTAIVGSRQNARGGSSTQTNGGAPHQSP